MNAALAGVASVLLMAATRLGAATPAASLAEVVRADAISSLVVRPDNNLYLTKPDGEVVQLTRDGVAKDMPLFSPDGAEIAFAESADRGGGKAMIVVVDRQGRELYRVYVHPKQPVDAQAADDDPDAMTHFDGYQWLSGSRIAVSGAINPSSGENLVYDLPTRGLSYRFFDDGGVAYAPNGARVAYLSGMAHFAPQASWAPVLMVVDDPGVRNDSFRVYPVRGAPPDIRFISQPAWSVDSESLGVLVEDLHTRLIKLVVWDRARNPAVTEAELPAGANRELLPNTSDDDRAVVFHGANGWIVAAERGAWQLGMDGKTFLPVQGSAATHPAIAARALRRRLERAATDAGARVPWSTDFWCPSCSLSTLPRRTHE